MRVLITGMGGELGTRVASLLEADEAVDEIIGIDIDPPRRRLRRSHFHRVDPRDRARTAALVVDVAPTVVVHLGIFEPNARSGPHRATAYTASGTVALFGALEQCPVERVVVRSGIEVYGRRRGSPWCPDEDVVADPTSPFGHNLWHVERVALDHARRQRVPTALLRFAPLVGPHFPSPLGRLLRLPAVPHSALGDPPFSVLHQEDAAQAVVAAVRADVQGPVNVVGPGAVTAAQAARIGGRVPVPVAGYGWRLARFWSETVGAPLADHVRELLVRGRTAGSGRYELLGLPAPTSTPAVIEQLFEWAEVMYLRIGDPSDEAAV